MLYMEICLPVEVEGKYGEFYPAVISGLNSLEEFHVNFLDSTLRKQVLNFNLPPTSLRLPPDSNECDFEPNHGQEVDIFISSYLPKADINGSIDTESPKLSAWWPGEVKKVGGSFVIVQISADFDGVIADDDIQVLSDGRVYVPHMSTIEKTDIVEKHQLRPRSYSQKLSPSSFHVHHIDIPPQVVSYCKEPGNYCHFARRCGSPVLMCMASEKMANNQSPGSQLLVVSTDVAVVHRASVIDNTFIDMLRQKVSILEQTEELSKKLEASKLKAHFVEEFVIPANLVRYAIGDHNSNLQRASSIDGILNIEIDRNNGLIKILANTEESLKLAKGLLNFSQKLVDVPCTYVGQIVGSGFKSVQKIVDRIGLVAIKIYQSETNKSYVTFQITGTWKAIEDAQLFLEFHVTTLQELDRLRGIEEQPSLCKIEQLMDNCINNNPSPNSSDEQHKDNNDQLNKKPRRPFNKKRQMWPAQRADSSNNSRNSDSKLSSVPSSDNRHFKSGFQNDKWKNRMPSNQMRKLEYSEKQDYDQRHQEKESNAEQQMVSLVTAR